MSRRRPWLLLLAAVLLAALLPGRGTEAQSPGVYIALGDSIAAGTGSSLPRTRSYPAIVTRWMEAHAGANVPLSNLAVPGETAASFFQEGQLDSFRSEVTRAREGQVPIHAVTVSLGGNEILAVRDAGVSDRQQALDAYRENLARAISAIRQEIGPDVPLVLTTYYDLTGGDPNTMFTDSWWVARFNEVIGDVAAQYSARVADVTAAFEGRIDELTYNPIDVHPTNQGYLAIARQVWQALNLDVDAPVIDGVSPETAMRRTPTLKFRASDDVGIESIVIQIEGRDPIEPLRVADEQYIELLDLRSIQSVDVTVQIVATDQAGNRTSVDHSIRLNGSDEAGQ